MMHIKLKIIPLENTNPKSFPRPNPINDNATNPAIVVSALANTAVIPSFKVFFIARSGSNPFSLSNSN